MSSATINIGYVSVLRLYTQIHTFLRARNSSGSPLRATYGGSPALLSAPAAFNASCSPTDSSRNNIDFNNHLFNKLQSWDKVYSEIFMEMYGTGAHADKSETLVTPSPRSLVSSPASMLIHKVFVNIWDCKCLITVCGKSILQL